MIILLVFALLLIYPSSAFCPPSSFNYTAGPGLDVFLGPGDPLVIDINVTGTFPVQPVDVYILWDTSYSSRSFSYHYWRPNSRRLLGIMNATLQQNPYVRFGLGFFTTKRLLDIGHGSDYVYRHVVDITSNISKVDYSFSGLVWATAPAVGPYTSSLEAFLQVMLTSNNTGFRPGSRRIVLLATDVMFGQQGNVAARTLSPLIETEDNITFAFPRPNNYNGVLEANCTLTGNVCYDNCSPVLFQPRTANPSIYCQCGVVPINTLVPGVIDKHNISQFAAGSCEDFPTQAGVAAIAQAQGFELIAFTPIDTLGTNVSNAFRQLNLLIGSGSVITSLDLRNRLPPLVPQSVGAIPVAWNVSTIAGYTVGPCNLTWCSFHFEFVYPPGGAETGGVIVINGDYNITVDVEVCVQSESPSASKSQSWSNSRSESRSDSKSESPSESHSDSYSESKSKSQSITPSESHSHSQSKSASSSQTLTPSESPSESASESPSESLSPSESFTPSESPTPSNSGSESESPTPSLSGSQSTSKGITQSPSASHSQSDSRSTSGSHSQSSSRSLSASHSQSDSRSHSPSSSSSQSLSSATQSIESPSVSISISSTQVPSQTPETPSVSASLSLETPSVSISESQVPSQSPSASGASASISHSKSQSQSQSMAPVPSSPSDTGSIIGIIVISSLLSLCGICLFCFGLLRRRRRRRPYGEDQRQPLLAAPTKTK